MASSASSAFSRASFPYFKTEVRDGGALASMQRLLSLPPGIIPSSPARPLAPCWPPVHRHLCLLPDSGLLPWSSLAPRLCLLPRSRPPSALYFETTIHDGTLASVQRHLTGSLSSLSRPSSDPASSSTSRPPPCATAHSTLCFPAFLSIHIYSSTATTTHMGFIHG